MRKLEIVLPTEFGIGIFFIIISSAIFLNTFFLPISLLFFIGGIALLIISLRIKRRNMKASSPGGKI